MSGFEFELKTAEEVLVAAKLKMREFFLTTHADGTESKLSRFWFDTFNNNVNRVLRRQGIKFGFGPGGGPEWFADAFIIFGEVIKAEYEHGKLLARKLTAHNYEE